MTPFYLKKTGKKNLRNETFRDQESATQRSKFHVESRLGFPNVQKVLNAKPYTKKSKYNQKLMDLPVKNQKIKLAVAIRVLGKKDYK